MEYLYHIPSSRYAIGVHKHLGQTFPRRRELPREAGEAISSWGQPKARATQLGSDRAEEIWFALWHGSCSQEKPDDYLQIFRCMRG